jgi:hypothetical protein
LYLDTAELLYIADGRADEGLVRDLAQAMWAHCMPLVVSLEHLQDAIPRATDPDTRNRVADALERFELRAVVIRSPGEIEPWTTPEADIELAPAANIRELLMSREGHHALVNLTSMHDALHAANVDFRELLLSDKATFRKAEYELWLQCFITLVRGWRGTDVGEIVSYWQAKSEIQISDAIRDSMRAHLQPVSDLVASLGDAMSSEEARTHILTSMSHSFASEGHVSAPGLFLSGQLASCRSRNRTRIPTVSDALDGMHVTHFPYVDVATCDRQTYGCIIPHLEKIVRPRRPRIIRNGDLREVLRAVEGLPFPASPADLETSGRSNPSSSD